jgi:class 3 adenylate cyclase
MWCPQCQYENRAGRRFCAECGAPLPVACPACGFTNEPGEKFCGGCGMPLAGPASQPPQPAQHPATSAAPTHQETPPPVAQGTPEAERRQLTVLFCDLVDSTVLAHQLDPEELRAVVRAYQDTCARVIARFDGHIAQYLGDGLLVYFGYPLAHEDDAQRAVRAGLGMIEALGQLNTHLKQERGVQLAVRLGIHTGLVVVGEVGGGTRQERLALGETPNLAARLQGIAAPNTLVLSAGTFQLLGGFFACKALGMHLLKGFPQAIEAFQVQHESTARSRLEAAGRAGLTPLVGREPEVALLRERWAQVKEGVGQVVLLSGEAGLSAKAVPYWLRAGQHASERSAYVEAIAHLKKGLALIETLPDTPERAQQELFAQMTLGPALMATKGQAVPEVEHAYIRARALCEQLGETPQLLEVLGGLRTVYEVRGELQQARELAEQLLSLVQCEQDPARLMMAHLSLGQTLFYLGEFAPARVYLEQAMVLNDGGRAPASVSPGHTGRGLWADRRDGRGAGLNTQPWGAFLRGGGAPAHRRVAADAGCRRGCFGEPFSSTVDDRWTPGRADRPLALAFRSESLLSTGPRRR